MSVWANFPNNCNTCTDWEYKLCGIFYIRQMTNQQQNILNETNLSFPRVPEDTVGMMPQRSFRHGNKGESKTEGTKRRGNAMGRNGRIETERNWQVVPRLFKRQRSVRGHFEKLKAPWNPASHQSIASRKIQPLTSCSFLLNVLLTAVVCSQVTARVYQPAVW